MRGLLHRESGRSSDVRYDVTYQFAPAWKVGEDGALRLLRAPNRAAFVGNDHYPTDYTGRIQSVVPTQRKLGPHRTKGFWRSVVMELDDAERDAARQRKLKVVGIMLRPATLDDDYGVLAPGLRVRFGPDARVRDLAERGASLKAYHRLAEKGILGEDIIRGRVREEDRDEDVAAVEFWDHFERETNRLLKTIAHTGAGYYAIDVDGATTGDTVGAYDENICLQSENPTITPWAGTIGVKRTHDTTAPNGQETGTYLKSIAAQSLQQDIAVVASTQYTMSFYVKAADSGATHQHRVYDLSNANYIYAATNYTPGATWSRVSVTFTTPVGCVSIRLFFMYLSAADEDLYFWGAQLEATATASLYKPTRASGETSITLQTGGLTDGDHDGEFLNFTVADNDYQIIRSGVDSVLVTADATGEGGAGTALTFAPHVTVQSGGDQLWVDQGATTFTSTQRLRIFGGTYVENVVFNSSLTGNLNTCKGLIIEGDPNDNRDNIVISPGSGISMDIYTAHPRVRHLKVTEYIRFWTNAYQTITSDVNFDCGGGACWQRYAGGHVIMDCEAVSAVGTVAFLGSTFGGGIVFRNCRVRGHSLCNFYYSTITLEAVTMHIINGNGRLFGDGGGAAQWNISLARLANCTILCSVTGGIGLYANTIGRVELINNIFSGVDVPFRLITTTNSYDETENQVAAGIVIARNNYFHDYASGFWMGGKYMTLAEFEAQSGVYASGNVDGVDPLLVGGNDLSLQAGSPCPNAGLGTGIEKDAWGVETPNPYHPAIGADFSRDLPECGAPDLSIRLTRS